MSAYYNELDPYPAAWLVRLADAGHIAAGRVDARSIRDVRASDIDGATQAHFFAGIGAWSYALRLAGWDDARPVWTGSCPCQPFSAVGKRRGFEDERHLWPEWFRLIRECRPPVVFGEQVDSVDGRGWLDAVSTDLEGEGYAVGATCLCAAGVGAPHVRSRIYYVAHATGARLEGLYDKGGADGVRPVAPLVWRNWQAEPAVDRVANGLAGGGVAQLRAFGNAIVPQVAATFIRAVMEAL